MACQETRSTCPYCGVGCGVIIESDGQTITGVRGDPDHPANFGRLCTKGSTLHLTAQPAVQSHARLLHPMRRMRKGAEPVKVLWNEAIGHAADTFARIVRQNGPDAVGFYISGQLLTEDYYVFNKLAKGLIGTNNVDTNSRLCMSSAVAGYKRTLGADAPPASYEDLDHATCMFIVGSNTAWAHPILFRRIEAAKQRNPHLKIVVCDPRKTDTAEIADLYVPLLPGTDVMLFNGMLHLMLWEGWTNPAYIQAHTEGFDALKATVRDCTPERTAEVCGISKEQLLELTRLFARSSATLSLYCQGLNQSSAGTDKNAALINLHLATGHIGRAGAGPFSLTGQPNAMGGREVGGLSNLLSAHRDMANPVHREEVARLWGVDTVPATPGKSAVEMFEAAADGQIKALWIACTNPAQSMPDQSTVRRALERAEFVVVQEAFANTATCAYADLLLPATSWGEKTGTVTNSERRITRVRPAIAAPGQAQHDWVIVNRFARALEVHLRPNKATLFPYPTEPADAGAEMIWNEHRESTRGRDLDITGLSYARLNEAPEQWPFPEGARQGQARLYENGHFPTASGKARFADVPYKPLAEARDARYPFSLNTGRLRDQWHGMSRTGTLGRLFGHVAEPCILMHPQDMDRRRLKDGDLVYVTSRRASIVVPVVGSAEQALNQTFMGMHWGSEFLSGRSSSGHPMGGVNALTTPAYCPQSKQPELKHCAVKISKAEFGWTLLAVAWMPHAQALEAAQGLRQCMPQFDFASCVPLSNNTSLEQAHAEKHGVLFRAAHHETPPEDLINRVESLMGLNTAETLRYQDKSKGQRRLARLVRNGNDALLTGFMLGGDIRSESWIKALLTEELPAKSYGRLLLLPSAQAPVAVESSGKRVCVCMNVSDTAIRDCLSTCSGGVDERLAVLQSTLKCGTSCGSCVPEIKRMIRQHTETEATV